MSIPASHAALALFFHLDAFSGFEIYDIIVAGAGAVNPFFDIGLHVGQVFLVYRLTAGEEYFGTVHTYPDKGVSTAKVSPLFRTEDTSFNRSMVRLLTLKDGRENETPILLYRSDRDLTSLST